MNKCRVIIYEHSRCVGEGPSPVHSSVSNRLP
jgi:hypothetical protein